MIGRNDLYIAAPESDWRELLQPVPRPFYQDLMAAMRQAIEAGTFTDFAAAFAEEQALGDIAPL